MLLVPCAVGVAFTLLFVARLADRRFGSRAGRPVVGPGAARHVLRRSAPHPGLRTPDGVCQPVLIVIGHAFPAMYQAYFLLAQLAIREHDVAHTIFLGTVAQSAALVATTLVTGKLSDRTGRRRIFVLAAAIVYGLALFVVASADDVRGYLIGMASVGWAWACI